MPVQTNDIVVSKKKVMLSKAATAPFDALRLLRVPVAAASKHDFTRKNAILVFRKNARSFIINFDLPNGVGRDSFRAALAVHP